MLVPALLAALALGDPPPVDAPQAEPTPPAEPAPAVAPNPAAAPTQTPSRDAALALRQNAEEKQLEELLPPALTEKEIRAIAVQLGAAPDADEAIQHAIDRYAAATTEERLRAVREIRPRLTAAYVSTNTGMLEPAAGPEHLTVLKRSQAWRELLASADTDLLRLIANVRTEHATALPPIIAYTRTAKRDDMPSLDPVAGLRMPALLDEAKLDPAVRRRAEDSLDRHWTRTAAAIANRRKALLALDIERAELLEEWGPAWELTAPPRVMAERQKLLTALDARARTAEDELRTVAREATMQLIRTLPGEPGTRVRSIVDSLMWPSLFVQETLLAQSLPRAAQGADPALLGALQGVMLETQRKLETSRRELTRRASQAEELDSVLAGAELGATDASAIAALNAHLELQDVMDRRRKILRAAAQQLHGMAVASSAPNAALLLERITALDSDARAAQWLRDGIAERLAQLNSGARDNDIDAPTPEPAPEAQR